MRRPLKVLDPARADPSQEGDEEIMMMIAQHQGSLQAFLRSLVLMGGEVEEILQKLSASNQELMHDRYGLGLSLAECAKKWERSEGGLRVAFHRLRTTLRACLERKQRKDEA